MQNHYFDRSHPLHPYTHSALAAPDTIAPINALRSDLPPQIGGKHPGEKKGKWVYIDDHRGREGYVNGAPHVISDFGPLPEGWSDTPPPPSLAEAKAAKQVEISAAFNAAMSASLAMPSVGTPPSSFEVASALYDWRNDDPEGYASLLAIHTARREALLAAVGAATTPAEVQAITANYAVSPRFLKIT